MWRRGAAMLQRAAQTDRHKHGQYRRFDSTRTMPAMARDKTVYTCTACGGTSPKWLGKCPHCGEWNTLEEGVADSGSAPRHRYKSLAPSQPVEKRNDERSTSARPPWRSIAASVDSSAYSRE